MIDLIEMIEAASGPSFALDTEIAYAIDHPMEGLAKPYTASLDAALTLVPDGWRIYTADFSIINRARWMLEGPKLTWIEHEDGSKEGGNDWYSGAYSLTPELALCAAALRARMAMADAAGEAK